MKHSIDFDIAEEINPIKKVSNIFKYSISAAYLELNEGFWLGKRPFRYVGLTVYPGVDVLEWAIMIDGVVYYV